jgi:hypothetical protein
MLLRENLVVGKKPERDKLKKRIYKKLVLS